MARLPAPQGSLQMHGIPTAVLEKWQIAIDPRAGEGHLQMWWLKLILLLCKTLGAFLSQMLSVLTNNLVKSVIAWFRSRTIGYVGSTNIEKCWSIFVSQSSE